MNCNVWKFYKDLFLNFRVSSSPDLSIESYFLMVSSLILLRSLRVYILKQLFFSISVKSGFRILSRIYRLREKYRVAEDDMLPRGVRGMPSGNFLKWICSEMQSLWCILRHNFEKFYCLRNDLVGSRWFSRYNYSYTVMKALFLRGESGHLGREASTPQIP